MAQDAVYAQFLAQAAGMKSEAVAIRRDLHAHPELRFEEVRTAATVAAYLRELGLEVRTGVAETGVVGLLRGGRVGPTVMVRADMDALPIQEENDAEYASRRQGVMHACGHDGHTTIGLMTARLLSSMRDEVPGTVKFVFQPAEETLNGARAMIAAGVLENPRVDAALGLHLWSTSPLGTVSSRPGPLLAAADSLHVVVRGKGGHAAMPHNGVDPITTSAHVVTAVQSIVSRNVSPLEAGVISFGTIHGGTALNVIPEEVALTGTIRTFKESVRKTMHRRVQEVIEGTAAAFGAAAEVNVTPVCEPTVNDARMTELVMDTARRMFGDEKTVSTEGVMGSEDMSFFLREVPGCFFFIGAARAAGPNFAHHNPRFDFDEDVLPLGAALMGAAVLRYLSGQR
jgi:amidohydrolase